jgi:hypothetical protein
VQIGAGQPTHPMVRVVGTGIAQDLRARDHPLANSQGRWRQSSSRQAAQAANVNATVAVHLLARGARLLRLYSGQDYCKPRAAARCVLDDRNSLAAREAGGTSQRDVLDVVEFQRGRTVCHETVPARLLHLVSAVAKAALSLRAFLISSALT